MDLQWIVALVLQMEKVKVLVKFVVNMSVKLVVKLVVKKCVKKGREQIVEFVRSQNKN